MKNIFASHHYRGPWVAGALLPLLMAPVMAADFSTSDGKWTLSVDGNVNVDYIYSNCESASSAHAVAGGLACVGTASSSNVSNVGNGLLPAALTFGIATTQDGFDIAAHFGLYPGIATNDGGSPNLQANSTNGSSNTALGTTGLDVRQVYMTFGNKDMGTFTLGRNFGLFGFDVIINDMTLPGVGGPGSAASAAPANTTLGGIGLGYIYVDTLAQMDYTTPDFAGFDATIGIFDPINSASNADIVGPKKAPGFHGKLAYTLPISDGVKFYASATFITQEQDYTSRVSGNPYSYTGTGYDVFAKIDVQAFEAFGYYYHGSGLGTTGLFISSDDGFGDKRDSNGYLFQASYKFGPLKVGVNYGSSDLDFANGVDAAAAPTLVSSNRKGTVGLYYSLTKNLTLLAEGSNVKAKSHDGFSNTANTVNIGAFVGF
jgi:predicted porin